MAKILNWNSVQKILKEKKILIFTPQDLTRLFNVSSVAANFFVFRNTKRGLLVRLKKTPKGSLYCFSDNMPSQYLIANKIYEPSYISFDTALSFHKIIPETIYTMTSATTQSTREFIVSNISFRYYRIKRDVYTGYRLIKYFNDNVLIAEAEKALADYLYFVDLKKRQLIYERLNLKVINKQKLIGFVKLFNRPGMLKLIEQIYADQRKYSKLK
jgi:predicted transcriptional regulator of viral defense system